MKFFNDSIHPVFNFFDIFFGHFVRLVEKTQVVIRAFTAGTDKNTVFIKIILCMA